MKLKARDLEIETLKEWIKKYNDNPKHMTLQ